MLAEHLLRRPEIVPLGIAPHDGTAQSMAIAYAAGGTVAAAEAWLAAGDLDDIERAVHVMLSASPQWWGYRQ
jgi:hypothetical protein